MRAAFAVVARFARAPTDHTSICVARKTALSGLLSQNPTPTSCANDWSTSLQTQWWPSSHVLFYNISCRVNRCNELHTLVEASASPLQQLLALRATLLAAAVAAANTVDV